MAAHTKELSGLSPAKGISSELMRFHRKFENRGLYCGVTGIYIKVSTKSD